MLVYVAGSYRGDVGKNIANARKVSIALWQAGHYVICPHLNTAHMDKDAKGVTDEDFLAGTKAMMYRCDVVAVVWDSEESVGTQSELHECDSLSIPYYHIPDPGVGSVILPEPLQRIHPVEQRCPGQVEAFIKTIMRMYRVHLQKNMDYSPANILGTGEVGSIVRLWDKMARLMNLLGFQIEIAKPATYTQPAEPNFESIDDTLLDLANYAVIAKLLRENKWGS